MGTTSDLEKTTRVGIPYGNPVIRAGLTQLLGRRDMIVSAEASTVDEAVSLMSQQASDVAIADPDSDDITLHAITQLVEAGVTRVLVFTAVTDPKVHRHAYELGALGVVQKDQAPETLVQAIRTIRAGQAWLERLQGANLLSAIRRRRDPEEMKIDSLTKREREVIALVGQGLNSVTIGERLFITEATVRHHLTSILGKLELSNRYELAVYAFRRGLVDYRVPPPVPAASSGTASDARLGSRRAVGT
jgi:DNA-binding NarL/FixJ family response regulator